jgi:hypothetical protein
LNNIDYSDIRNLKYKDQSRRVNLDEKWFFLERLRYIAKYIPGDSVSKHDTCQHKSHRSKIMITAAICQPTQAFNGKIGLFPYTV